MSPSPARLNIAYFGLPLGALLLARDGHEPALCVLAPVPAPGARRARARLPNVLDAAALGHALQDRVSTELERLQPDLIVSWFWTRRLPTSWLATAKIAAIGVHPSLLPRHRGPNPYFWAIDAGDDVTGVSVHLLEAEYDTGAVLAQESLPIGERNSWQLARALDRPSLRLLRRTVADYAVGRPPTAVPQDPSRATPAPEPSGDLLRVDFHQSTERVLRRIRALSPVPGVALSLFGCDFFVTAARPAASHAAALVPGEAQITHSRLLLRTADGAIAVERAALSHGVDEEPEELSGEALARLLEERRRENSWKPGLE